MRFSAPRSTSPSPERSNQVSPSLVRSFVVSPQKPRRRAFSYGLHDDDESDESDESESESVDDDDGQGDTLDADPDDDLADSLQYVSISPPR